MDLPLRDAALWPPAGRRLRPNAGAIALFLRLSPASLNFVAPASERLMSNFNVKKPSGAPTPVVQTPTPAAAKPASARGAPKTATSTLTPAGVSDPILQNLLNKVSVDRAKFKTDLKASPNDLRLLSEDSATLNADLQLLANGSTNVNNGNQAKSQVGSLFTNSPKNVPATSDVTKRTDNKYLPNANIDTVLSVVAQQNGSFLKKNISSALSTPPNFTVKLFNKDWSPITVNVPQSTLPKGSTWVDVYRSAMATVMKTTPDMSKANMLSLITGKPATSLQQPIDAKIANGVFADVQKKTLMGTVDFSGPGAPTAKPGAMTVLDGQFNDLAKTLKGIHKKTSETDGSYASGALSEKTTTDDRVVLADGSSISAWQHGDFWSYTDAKGKTVDLPLNGNTIKGVDPTTKNIILGQGVAGKPDLSVPPAIVNALMYRLTSGVPPA
jgi:hypothetical protein